MRLVKFLSIAAAIGLLSIGALCQDAVATEKPAKPAKPEKPAVKQKVAIDVSALKAVTVKGTVKIIEIDPAKNPRLAMGLEFQLTGDATSNVIAGPKKYIETKLELKLTDGVVAEVAGWEQKTAKSAFILAKTITVDGKVYILRDEKGMPVWEAEKLARFKELTKAELEKAEIIGVNGIAKLPEGVPADEPSFMRFAVDEKTIVLIAPKKIADAFGIEIKEGDKLVATGWKVVRGEKTFVLAREVTVNDKMFNLRDFDGKIIKQKEAKPANGGRNGGKKDGGNGAGKTPKANKEEKPKGEKAAA